jgi:hypothetical protein
LESASAASGERSGNGDGAAMHAPKPKPAPSSLDALLGGATGSDMGGDDEPVSDE